MTEAAAAPPGPVWVLHKIAYIAKDGKSVRLISPDGQNDEYQTKHLNLSIFTMGDSALARIEHGILRDLRIPPGGPVQTTSPTEKPVAKPEPSQPAPVQTTAPIPPDVTILTSLHLDDAIPYVVLTNARGEFKKLVKPEAIAGAKEIQPGKIIRYKTDKESTGTPIVSIWEVDATGESVKPRSGGGGRSYDPVAEARRQLWMVRENVLNRAVELWINGNPGKVADETADDNILARAEFFEKWVMREGQ